VSNMKVLLVGGGRAGRQMLELARHSSEIEVKGVVDLRPDAPGMVLARELGVPAYTSQENAILASGAELIMDLTGSGEARAKLEAGRLPHQEVLSGISASFVHSLLIETQEKRSKETSEQLARELHGFLGKLESATTSIQGSLVKIGEVMRRMQVVSLNAGIEAAKAGAAGKGFGVIAEEMARMTAFATQAVDGVRDAAQQTDGALSDLKRTEQRMRELNG
jgi:hypothetical protein